ncbi:MAG TPA: type II toxin-antitoxin system mRNA interferase toxin, RelE/StbE family [Candidatus Paceibacterota bacterium]
MYEIISAKKFRSSYKKVSRSGNFDLDEFEKVLEFLRKGEGLPKRYFDHALKANLGNKRECHISGDMLLTYEVRIDYKVIVLSDIGNHAHVFGS